MHGPSVCHKAGVCKVSRKWERCIWAFMDLEKAYDTVDRHGVWQMLSVYGVEGKLMKAVQSFYVDSMGRVSGWEMM